jgi:hypothetical protein
MGGPWFGEIRHELVHFRRFSDAGFPGLIQIRLGFRFAGHPSTDLGFPARINPAGQDGIDWLSICHSYPHYPYMDARHSCPTSL